MSMSFWKLLSVFYTILKGGISCDPDWEVNHCLALAKSRHQYSNHDLPTSIRMEVNKR